MRRSFHAPCLGLMVALAATASAQLQNPQDQSVAVQYDSASVRGVSKGGSSSQNLQDKLRGFVTNGNLFDTGGHPSISGSELATSANNLRHVPVGPHEIGEDYSVSSSASTSLFLTGNLGKNTEGQVEADALDEFTFTLTGLTTVDLSGDLGFALGLNALHGGDADGGALVSLSSSGKLYYFNTIGDPLGLSGGLSRSGVQFFNFVDTLPQGTYTLETLTDSANQVFTDGNGNPTGANGAWAYSANVNLLAVPEPFTTALSLGAVGLFLGRKRRTKVSA